MYCLDGRGVHTSHDAPEVVSHVAEVQVVLCHGKVCLKGSYLLSQYEQLLYGEQLGIHHTTLLSYLPACSLYTMQNGL